VKICVIASPVRYRSGRGKKKILLIMIICGKQKNKTPEYQFKGLLVVMLLSEKNNKMQRKSLEP
jgi:hypothetical protein